MFPALHILLVAFVAIPLGETIVDYIIPFSQILTIFLDCVCIHEKKNVSEKVLVDFLIYTSRQNMNSVVSKSKHRRSFLLVYLY